MQSKSRCSTTCRLILGATFCILTTSWAAAEPIWHCSRTKVQVADASDNFTLASLLDREVIQISLADLHNAYRGKSVRLSGRALSVCVAREDASTPHAMETLGLSEKAVISLGRRNGITQPNVHLVHNAREMATCIEQHHPAIGYFSQPNETESLGPCF